jgi:peroxiredoxin (alkyl hydroperoxide reductase subunit C)
MNVKLGERAPQLTAEAYVKGKLEPVPVAIPATGSWTVLFFYPRDYTVVCPTELAAYEDARPALERRGARVVAASTDSWWVHRAWFGSNPWLENVSYPVVADAAHELAKAYGVLRADGAAERATFVVDPDGILRHVSVTDVTVGRSAEETVRIVQALQTGELCPANWRPGQATLRAA